MSQKVIRQIEEILFDLRLDLRNDKSLVNKIDDILDLVRKLKNKPSGNNSDNKFRKFRGLVL